MIHVPPFILDADTLAEDMESTFRDEPTSGATLILQRCALAISFDRDAVSCRDADSSACKDVAVPKAWPGQSCRPS